MLYPAELREQVIDSPPGTALYQGLTREEDPEVDAVPMVMDSLRDQSVTTHRTAPFQAQAAAPEAALPMRAPKRRKGGKPVAIVRSGSVALPVYQCRDGSSTRFILSYHRAGKRVRQSFTSLEKAKKEALLVAHRIQSGMQHVTDMTPADRDAFRARLGLPDGRLAAIAAAHTFGDYLVFHPHLHVLAACGLFDREGAFHCLPDESPAPIIELFRHRFDHIPPKCPAPGAWPPVPFAPFPSSLIPAHPLSPPSPPHSDPRTAPLPPSWPRARKANS